MPQSAAGPQPISENERRWLQTIRYAEGTDIPQGYSTTFGYQQFDPSKGHPNRVVRSGRYASAAAGAYQFMPETWSNGARQAGVDPGNMSPENQDRVALQLIRNRGVDPTKPISPDAVARLSPEWASLPTRSGKSYYGQPVRGYDALTRVFGRQVQPGSTGSTGGTATGGTPTGGMATGGTASGGTATGGTPTGGTATGGIDPTLLALLGGSDRSRPAGMDTGSVADLLSDGTGNTAVASVLRQQRELLGSNILLDSRRRQLARDGFNPDTSAIGSTGALMSGGPGPLRMAGSPGRTFMQRILDLSQPLQDLA